MSAKPFWETKALDAMNDEEWESLCDGCGRCCLHKLVNDETGDVFYTRVACKLLNTETSRCARYDKRFNDCLLYTSPSPRDATLSRMPSSA